MTDPTPKAIAEAERLVILAEHIRSRLKADGEDVHVLGMAGLALDIEANGAGQEQGARLMEIMAGIEQATLKLQDQRLKNQGTALKLAHEQERMRNEVTVQ